MGSHTGPGPRPSPLVFPFGEARILQAAAEQAGRVGEGIRRAGRARDERDAAIARWYQQMTAWEQARAEKAG